jgi:hypothetical protein
MNKTDFRGTDYSLGIRNNNPGNLRPLDNGEWNGQVGENKGFCVFEDIRYGIRALAMDLINKQRRGLDTIRKIISVYAPPEENDTDRYIGSVSYQVGVPPDFELKLEQSTVTALVRAVINHENKANDVANTITMPLLHEGIALIPDHLKELIGLTDNSKSAKKTK